MNTQNETPEVPGADPGIEVGGTDSRAPGPDQPTNPPDHEQVAPDPTPPEAERVVGLLSLLIDEFGMAPENARNLAQGGTLEIDGEKYDGDLKNLPYAAVVGKELTVKGDVHSVRFTYNG